MKKLHNFSEAFYGQFRIHFSPTPPNKLLSVLQNLMKTYVLISLHVSSPTQLRRSPFSAGPLWAVYTSWLLASASAEKMGGERAQSSSSLPPG